MLSDAGNRKRFSIEKLNFFWYKSQAEVFLYLFFI